MDNSSPRYCRVCRKLLVIHSPYVLTVHEFECFKKRPDLIPKNLLRTYFEWLYKERRSKSAKRAWVKRRAKNAKRTHNESG